MGIEGVDYTTSDRPSVAALKAAGKVFACRYGGPGGAWKQIGLAEVRELTAAGIAIVANAEGTADGLKYGRSAGISWATDAEQHFRALGMPADRPIYFSVDFDTGSGDWAALDAAFDGIASVIGRERTGVYGEYSIMRHFAGNGRARWFWQTYAWSGGQWFTGNHIEQYRNGVALGGGTVDLNRAKQANYGQWGVDEMLDLNQPVPIDVVDGKDKTVPLGIYLRTLGIRTNWIGNVFSLELRQRLDAILAAALDDGDVTVQMAPEQVAKLQEAIAALDIPTPAEIGDAVVDELHNALAE